MLKDRDRKNEMERSKEQQNKTNRFVWQRKRLNAGRSSEGNILLTFNSSNDAAKSFLIWFYLFMFTLLLLSDGGILFTAARVELHSVTFHMYL